MWFVLSAADGLWKSDGYGILLPMSQSQHFQARDLGNGVLEIIGIFPGMGAQHPAVQALEALARKFRQIIFTLEPGASFDMTALPKLLNVASLCAFRIVATTPESFPFDKSGIAVFPSVQEALRAIKVDAIVAEVFKKMDNIPQLHSQAYEILNKLGDPTTQFADLERLFAGEVALATQVLKTANSAFFMRRAKVETLSAALAYLGMDGVRQILVFNVFKGVTTYLGVQKEVLDHGKCCAHLATWLAGLGKIDRPTQGKIRLAGLLHDIGSLALAFCYPKEYDGVKSLIRQQNKLTFEAEREVFGVEHQELGRRLAAKWAFPDYLAQVIGDHHNLRETAWDNLTGPVFCANGFLNQHEKIPFSPYYQRLRAYFAHLPEKTTIAELQTALGKELEQFVSGGGLTAE